MEALSQHVIVFKTDIENTEVVNRILPVLEKQKSVMRWSVDLEDVDKVLRIETRNNLTESYFSNLLLSIGVKCTVMTW